MSVCCDVKHPVGLRSHGCYEKMVSNVIEGIDAIYRVHVNIFSTVIKTLLSECNSDKW